ncbi:MAG: hypothetical protein JSU86_08445, partial [Phycisphaerales bacterium]
MDIRSNSIFRLMGIFTTLGIPLCCVGTTRAGDDLADLARLVEANGEEYIRLRDALLKQHRQPWDVTPAADQSWETGLVAFVLNARMEDKEGFADLDAQRPRHYANGKSYRLTGAAETAVAFLMEKMWKAGDDRETARAYGTLRRLRGEKVAHAGETALWKAIWEQCEDERFRYAVLRNICADPDPSVQPIIEEFLQREDDQLAGYSAKPRCLAGLWHRDTEQTVDAILNAWDVLAAESGWKSDAVGALNTNSSERARRIVYKLVLDPAEDETLRAETAARCCLRPHPDDPDMFRKFFAGPGSIKMKNKALKGMRGRNGYPLDPIRPVLREIIITSDDEELTESAALTLTSCYRHAKDVN